MERNRRVGLTGSSSRGNTSRGMGLIGSRSDAMAGRSDASMGREEMSSTLLGTGAGGASAGTDEAVAGGEDGPLLRAAGASRPTGACGGGESAAKGTVYI